MIDKKADARPSMYSVAAYAGVSIATVSKVMQGVTTVRKENVIAVQNAIEALGYRINPLGAELRRGQRKLVGVIVSDFENAESAGLLAAIERDVEDRGFTVLAASSRQSEAREIELVGRMQDWRVAGMIIESAANRKKAALLLKDGPPVVFIANSTVAGDFDVVLEDVATALASAARKNDGALQGVFITAKSRVPAVEKALKTAGVRLTGTDPAVVVLTERPKQADHVKASTRAEAGNLALRIEPDSIALSSAAVAQLFVRMDDPEGKRQSIQVPSKVSRF
jgi:LacI family transcriptional regulator